MIIFLAIKGESVIIDINRWIKNSLIFLLTKPSKAGTAAINSIGATESLIVTATRLKKATSSHSDAARCLDFFQEADK